MTTGQVRDLLKIIKERERENWKLKDENEYLKLKIFDKSSEKLTIKYGPLNKLETRISQLERENFLLTILLEKDRPNDQGEWLSSLERLAMIETQDTDDPFFKYSCTDEEEDLENTSVKGPREYKKWEFFSDGSSTSEMR